MIKARLQHKSASSVSFSYKAMIPLFTKSPAIEVSVDGIVVEIDVDDDELDDDDKVDDDKVFN